MCSTQGLDCVVPCVALWALRVGLLPNARGMLEVEGHDDAFCQAFLEQATRWRPISNKCFPDVLSDH